MKWVAQQLGHSSPELTLRTYAHVLQEEETDLSFTDVGTGAETVADGSERLYASPAPEGADGAAPKSAVCFPRQG